MRIALVGTMIFGMAIAAHGKAPKKDVPSDTSKITVADLSWLSGRWRGDVPDATVEQTCSRPEAGQMLCMFRLIGSGKVQMFELISFQDAPDGVELRIRQFNPSLAEKKINDPIVMKLGEYSDKEVRFDGAPGAEARHSTILRTSADAMTGKVEVAGKDGKSEYIVVQWHRVPYGKPLKAAAK